MKRLNFLLISVLVFVTAFALGMKTQVSAQGKADYVKNEILVKFKGSASTSEIADVHKKIGGKVKEVIGGINVAVVDIGAKSVGEMVSTYARNSKVEFVEPNFYAIALTNDTYFSNQWGLDNTGQETCNTEGDTCTTGTYDADIDAPEAWVVTLGSSDVKIAILDSGIDQDHLDLDGKIVDNIDFSGSGSVNDYYGHGTHVAGIAAAETNNSLGVAGVGYDSSLLNVKVLGDNGYGAYSWIANGIYWATQNGAKVINMSLGSPQRSSTLEAAVNYAWGNGVVVVAAAGNSSNPSRTYPAYYSNCIAVASTDNNDVKASFSSYGSWVDVAAPGENIYSTFPTHEFYLQGEYGRSMYYDFGSGTSMSTPFVAGIAALIWAKEPGMTNQEVRDRIEKTSEAVNGTGTYWTWGRVNACNAVGGNCSTIPTSTPTPMPTPEPTNTVTPTPEPDACSLYCFKGVCDGSCHRVKEGINCPDCF